jgi:hypothetical protein
MDMRPPRAVVVQVFSAPPKIKRARQRERYDCRVGNPFAHTGKFSAKTASTRRQIHLPIERKRDRLPPIALPPVVDLFGFAAFAANLIEAVSPISTSMASSFETHRFAMLLMYEVSDPHGEEARSAVSNHEASEK